MTTPPLTAREKLMSERAEIRVESFIRGRQELLNVVMELGDLAESDAHSTVKTDDRAAWIASTYKRLREIAFAIETMNEKDRERGQ